MRFKRNARRSITARAFCRWTAMDDLERNLPSASVLYLGPRSLRHCFNSSWGRSVASSTAGKTCTPIWRYSARFSSAWNLPAAFRSRPTTSTNSNQSQQSCYRYQVSYHLFPVACPSPQHCKNPGSQDIAPPKNSPI